MLRLTKENIFGVLASWRDDRMDRRTIPRKGDSTNWWFEFR
jgi:hypothetical protein